MPDFTNISDGQGAPTRALHCTTHARSPQSKSITMGCKPHTLCIIGTHHQNRATSPPAPYSQYLKHTKKYKLPKKRQLFLHMGTQFIRHNIQHKQNHYNKNQKVIHSNLHSAILVFGNRPVSPTCPDFTGRLPLTTPLSFDRLSITHNTN